MATILDIIKKDYSLDIDEKEEIEEKLRDLGILDNDDFFGLEGARELIDGFLTDDGKSEYDQHCDLADEWWDEYSEENDLDSPGDYFDEEEAESSLEHYIEKNFKHDFSTVDIYDYKELAEYLGFPDVAIFSLENIPPYGKKIGTYEYDPFFPGTLDDCRALNKYLYPNYTQRREIARDWGHDASYFVDDVLWDIFPGYKF